MNNEEPNLKDQNRKKESFHILPVYSLRLKKGNSIRWQTERIFSPLSVTMEQEWSRLGLLEMMLHELYFLVLLAVPAILV
ncbi:hypothetical protein K7X08_031181 [Anisodus acutangulus]|uniref:Uncharacterized protein n=1 Tax=Anisodus acutangulus TaxID=402998 RepID=A0A9Q1RLW2_9SOLA|nr:hypothetical protein K7X08_031181 [Anisodus acutangulus]